MPNPDAPPLTRGVVLRGIGFAAAIVLGAIAVWLIVTSQSQKRIEIGILTGLWGLLLGAYSMFGARRGVGVEPYADDTRELAVREARTVERGDDAQARRDWEARLERLIQREISTAVSRETAALRSEIAHLRQDLLEKVGGQLRLERIETTRVIGSDLEALQHEVRQLKIAGDVGVKELLGEQHLALRKVVEPARVRPVSRPTAEVEADVRPAQRTPAEVADHAAAARKPVAEPVGQRPAQAAAARIVPPRREPASEPTRPAASVPTPAVPAAAAPAPVEPARPARVEQPRVEQPRVEQPRVEQPRVGQPRVTPVQRPAAPAPEPQRPTVQVNRPADPKPQTPPEPARVAPVEPARPAAQARPVQPAAPATPPAPASPAPSRADADPFASLPRIRPFTDFALDPTDPPPVQRPGGRIAGQGVNGTRVNGAAPHGAGSGSGPNRAVPNGAASNGAVPNGSQRNGAHNAPAHGPNGSPANLYTGRRRRTDEEVENAGRHSGTPAPPPPPAAEPAKPAAGPAEPGGRRRRTDGTDDGSDLLARLLARESVDR